MSLHEDDFQIFPEFQGGVSMIPPNFYKEGIEENKIAEKSKKTVSRTDSKLYLVTKDSISFLH